MAQTTSTVRSKVMSTIPKGKDVSLRVKVVKADGLELVDLRDWIPSLKKEGRGVNFPASLLDRVIEELQDLRKHVGTGNGSRAPGKNQERML